MAVNAWVQRQNVARVCPHVSTSKQPHVVAGARRQQQSKKRKGSKPVIEDRIDFAPDEADYDLVTSNGTPVLPRAPSPGSLRRVTSEDETGDDAPYPVYAPKPSTVKSVGSGPWSWADDGNDDRSGPVVPEWNPRTGFMRPAPPSLDSSRLEAEGTGAWGGGLQGPGESEGPVGQSRLNNEQQQGEVQADPQISLLTPSADASGDLPQVTQSQVLTSCIGTTFWMTVLAFFLRAYAQANAPIVLGTDEALLSQYLALPSGLENWANVGVLLGAAGLVTAARLQLLNAWPEFRVATERSNKQILSPLSWADIALVAVLTGVSEEILFRGAIIPGSFLDWRGVLLSGAIFGLLHNSGGRNAAFAAWAGAVGCLYGGAFLYTHNIWVPAAAHVIANFASAAVWKTRSTPKGQS